MFKLFLRFQTISCGSWKKLKTCFSQTKGGKSCDRKIDRKRETEVERKSRVREREKEREREWEKERERE